MGSLALCPAPNLEDQGLHFIWSPPFDLSGCLYQELILLPAWLDILYSHEFELVFVNYLPATFNEPDTELAGVAVVFTGYSV
jgi:hypothetical protein